MQGRGPARLVGDPDVHSVRELHYLDNSLHRRGKELRKGCWFCDWFDFAAVYFLSDPRLRQRAVSRRFGFAKGRGFSAAAACLGHLQRGRVAAFAELQRAKGNHPSLI